MPNPSNPTTEALLAVVRAIRSKRVWEAEPHLRALEATEPETVERIRKSLKINHRYAASVIADRRRMNLIVELRKAAA